MQEHKDYPVRVTIVTLRFDESGGGEKEEYTYAGRASDGDRYTLTYESGEGEEKQTTTLAFSPKTPEPMALTQSGMISCKLCFDTEKPYSTLYRVAGVGELDMEIHTRSVACEKTENGRRIRLDYEATVGGARCRTVMTILAVAV